MTALAVTPETGTGHGPVLTAGVDRAIRVSAAVAVLTVAGVAAYVSYWHAYAVVCAHGESGVTARLEPATIDGLVYASSVNLACADGGANIAVAARLGVSRATVAKWRARFLRDRLDGLSDEPRPGVPRTITDAQVEEVVVRTLEETPEGATHWSKRELARQVGISPASVLRIWHAFGLQPWRTESFKISPDPLLTGKIRDVVGLYLAPPANAAVFAVDEKPHIQALERTAPVLPMLPGVPERRSHDYVRHGTIDLFAALNTATGKVIGKLSAQHRAVDFRDFLDEIDRQAAPGLASSPSTAPLLPSSRTRLTVTVSHPATAHLRCPPWMISAHHPGNGPAARRTSNPEPPPGTPPENHRKGR
jgi:transposase